MSPHPGLPHARLKPIVIDTTQSSNSHCLAQLSQWIQKYSFSWVSPLLVDLYYRQGKPLVKKDLFQLLASQDVQPETYEIMSAKSTAYTMLDSELESAEPHSAHPDLNLYPKNRLESASSAAACDDELAEEFEMGLEKLKRHRWLPRLYSRSQTSSDYSVVPMRDLYRPSFASDDTLFDPSFSSSASTSSHLLFWQLLLFRATPLFMAGLLKLVADIASILIPVVLSDIINAVKSDIVVQQPNTQNTSTLEAIIETDREPLPFHATGLFYAMSLLVLLLLNTTFNNLYQYQASVIALQVKTAISAVAYRKLMRLDSCSKNRFDAATSISMLTVDGLRIEIFITQLHNMWSSPLRMAIIFAFMAHVIGMASLGGICLMLITSPIHHVIWKRLRFFRKETAPVTDARIKKLREFLSGVKVIKYFVWESFFFRQIQDIRKEETGQILQKSLLNAMAEGMIFNMAILASCLTFMLYGMHHELDPAVIFPILAWFNQLRFPMIFLPKSLVAYADFKVAVDRFAELLSAPDKMVASDTSDLPESMAISMQQACFSWESPSNVRTWPIIKYLDLNIKNKSLVAIVGLKGSGKTSLLHAMLGEMHLYSGKSAVQGSISCVLQHAWIMNASIRDNILFGRPFIRSKYRAILRQCALERDIACLAAGDSSLVGHGGITLSGGQKQRIQLARALYSDSDIYLLDDPLSAIDARVSGKLFDAIVMGALESKTRVMVTHRTDWLPHFDHIIFMRKGRIIEQGSFSELCGLRGEFYKLIASQKSTGRSSPAFNQRDDMDVLGQMDSLKKERRRDPSIPVLNSSEENVQVVTMCEEERAMGAVKLDVWKWYLQASGGWLCVVGVLVLLILINGLKIATDYWLIVWSDEKFKGLSAMGYVGTYALLALSQAVSLLLLGATVAFITTKAARYLHNHALERILSARMTFYMAHPVGRILNRFSKDQDVVDYGLSDSIRIFLNTTSTSITIFLMILVATPLSIFAIVPLLYGYYYLQQLFRPAARELKRLDSILESPLLTHIEQSISGLAIIRTFQNQKHFQDVFDQAMTEKNTCFYILVSAQRWLGMRLDALGSVIVFLAALLGIFGKGSLHPSILGLSLSYAIQITSTLNYCVHQFTETEIAMNAVERLHYYGHDIEQEPLSQQTISWSVQGSLHFDKVSLQYPLNGYVALKNISFHIQPGEKVAVVGRTGSGKSSLIHLITRLFEPTHGTVLMDGQDISRMPLSQLRSNIAVLPQDPVLFSGTIRMNLDPHSKYSDTEIWSMLEALDMDDVITEMGGLTATLHHGFQLSVGCKQLMCMARAMLTRPRLVVLDEASSSMDLDSEQRIHSYISQSHSMTVVHILHRLDYVLDYDRVLVMSEDVPGTLIEDDSPLNLLQQPKSVFHRLYHSVVE